MKNVNKRVLAFVIIGLFMYRLIVISSEGSRSSDDDTSSPTPNANTQTESVNEAINTNLNQDFNIVREVKTRFDNANTYYVLISEVDTSNEDYKANIRNIINSIVLEKGNKVSIEIYDDAESLDTYFKRYGDLSLDRPLTNDEISTYGVNLIATYDGEMGDVDIYNNTLRFFPALFSDHPTLGKHIESVEYNPSN